METRSHSFVNCWLRHLELSPPLSSPLTDTTRPALNTSSRKRGRCSENSHTQKGRPKKIRRSSLREIPINTAGMSHSGGVRRSQRLTARQYADEDAPLQEPVRMTQRTPFDIAEDSEDENFGANSLEPASGNPVATSASKTSSAYKYGDNFAIEAPQPSDQTSIHRKKSNSNSRTKSSRRSSPSKKSQTLPQLELNDTPIQHVDLSSSSLPREAKDLFRQIRHLTRGQGVLPERFSVAQDLGEEDNAGERLENEDEDDSDDADGEENDESIIEDNSFYSETAPLRRTPAASTISWLIKHAKQSNAVGASEAHWNCAVHAPALDLAKRLSRQPKMTDWRNITSASLLDVYCPQSYKSGSKERRKVDFAILLADNKLIQSIKTHKLVPFNATEDDSVYWWPISVLIETKTDSMKSGEAQLSLWSFAQLTRLRDTFGEAPAFIPCLLAVGAEWYVYFAEQVPLAGKVPGEEGSDDQRWKTHLYGNWNIGTLRYASGAYKVLALLALLFNWSAEVYMPWLKERVAKLSR